MRRNRRSLRVDAARAESRWVARPFISARNERLKAPKAALWSSMKACNLFETCQDANRIARRAGGFRECRRRWRGLASQERLAGHRAHDVLLIPGAECGSCNSVNSASRRTSSSAKRVRCCLANSASTPPASKARRYFRADFRLTARWLDISRCESAAALASTDSALRRCIDGSRTSRQTRPVSWNGGLLRCLVSCCKLNLII
jgi:hypothetical protein